MKRVAYFQEVAKTAGGPFNTERIHDLIQRSVSIKQQSILQYGGLSLMDPAILLVMTKKLQNLRAKDDLGDLPVLEKTYSNNPPKPSTENTMEDFGSPICKMREI